MKRIQVPVLAAMALLLVPGCKSGGGGHDGGAEMTIVVSGNAHLKEKEQQIARQRTDLDRERDELLAARQKLLTESKGGKDTKALLEMQKTLLAREKALRDREQKLDEERAQVSKAKDALLTRGGGGASSPAAREADITAREKAVAKREADVAKREKAVAIREARLAQREQSLSVRESLPALVSPAGEPGRKVSRKQAMNAHRQARRLMQKRGILLSDLPPEVAGLERRFYDLARKGHWAQAFDTANEQLSAVQGINVDESFIQHKMARLNALRSGRKLSAGQSKQVEKLLARATSAFADGREDAANLALNQMFGLLGK